MKAIYRDICGFFIGLPFTFALSANDLFEPQCISAR